MRGEKSEREEVSFMLQYLEVSIKSVLNFLSSGLELKKTSRILRNARAAARRFGGKIRIRLKAEISAERVS